MKLSEALIQRADIQKRVEQLRNRLQASAMVQEGDQPTEDMQALFAELDRGMEMLADLMTRINRTNVSATMASGRTLTDALAQRDVLKLRIGVLRSAIEQPAHLAFRFARTEIRRVWTFDVTSVRRQIDTLSQQYRELDLAIQTTNWETELLESA